MAMLHEPDLYILDEPTSGLDPIARRQIHDILLALKRDGKTILLSSHYLDEIEALADRVIILSAGQIVADGTPLELLARSAGASTLWLEVNGVDDPSRLLPQGDLRRPRRRAVSLSAPPIPPRRSSHWRIRCARRARRSPTFASSGPRSKTCIWNSIEGGRS